MRKTTKNTFSDGLNLDLHPIVTPNTVLTDNLNGTFITYNGNEFCLQNDRGNTKVAGLEDGFIPIGAKQYGGIIYIVSVNDNGLTEIGTYPGVNWNENEGVLDYTMYTQLGNLYTDSSYETKVEKGFRFPGPYFTNTPVTVDVQPSYDGSVNLIIIADNIKPIIINSGFSVLPEDKYKLIEREQSIDTNKYSLDRLSEQLNLVRESFEITNIDLIGVNSGGQLKGGNYKFYIKFGDADYNQTDVVAESGIVSVFHGNDGVASTISGTILDERTDKMIGLAIQGLNHVYSKIYIYYSREYSDSNGYRMTEFGMLNDPIDMVDKNLEERFPIGSHIDSATGAIVTDTIGGQTVWITGYEQTVPIDNNELNVDYHTVDFAKAETQQANMLFLGNIGRSEETFKNYNDLKDITLRFNVGITKANFVTTSTEEDLYLDSLYYNTRTIYSNLGYYPGEIYRFGIVYIFKDGSTSPVFNIKGGSFILNESNEYELDNTYSGNTSDLELCKSGVIIMPDESICPIFKSKSEEQNDVSAIGLSFTAPNFEKDNYNILGWFVVRQKRIPNVICQGLSAKVDRRSHTPTIYDGSNWISESFLSANRYETINSVQLRYDSAIYNAMFEGSDFEAWMNQMGYALNNNNISLKKYTSTSVTTYSTSDKASQAVYARTTTNNNTHYWMSDTYPFNTLLEFQNYIRSNNITQLYLTKYHLYIDGVIKKANKNNKQHEIEITYISHSADTPSYIYINPNVNHKANYYGINAGSYPVNDIENPHYAEYEEYRQKYGGSVKNKIIKEESNSNNLNDCFSSDALISLDPCVNPIVRSMLNGSEFYIKKSYDVSVHGYDSSAYYQYYSNFVSETEESSLTKAVFTDTNTAIKVVDNAAFSTVAGDVTDASKFSYFTTPCFVNRNTNTSYKQSNNINLLRGYFSPYIGILSNNFPIDSAGIYTIKQKDKFTEQDILVRAKDNSEYYCVSRRFLFDNRIEDVFGGDCYISTVTIRIIRNFIDQTAPISENILAPDAWYENVTSKYYANEGGVKDDTLVDFSEVNLSDVNTVDLGMWVTFRCLSNYNLGLRSKDYSHVDEMSVMGSPRTFHPVNSASTATGAKIEESWLLNDGYNSSVGRKTYNLLPDVPYTKSEFSNRIMFSNVNVTDSYSNGYRTFQGLSYKDYDKQYGPITKLVSWGNNLLCVMEHGIGLVAVNEKALMQTTTGETIHIYGHGVLSDTMQMLSQTYGSKYPHSVIRTPIGVYGIDTDARKIWRVTDKGFETISDMKIETYLNDNLFTNINSIIQTVDVRTHYNAFKGDVMFTFYNTENPYLIIPSTIDILEGEEYLLRIETNQSDLIFEINNTEIAEIVMRDNKKYIKGNLEGDAKLNIRNDILSKITNIKVRKPNQAVIIPTIKYLSKIPYNITIYKGDSITCDFTETINLANLLLSFNNAIVSVNSNDSGLVITGLKEGVDTLKITYGSEMHTCKINVLEVENPTEDIDDSGIIPGPSPIVDPDITPASNVYCTVYLHKPRINGNTPYPGNCSIFVTYEGIETEYEYTEGQEIKTLSLKKNSVITMTTNITEYSSGTQTVTITSDKQNVYFRIGSYVTLTINSISPDTATVYIDDDVVGEGVYTYPYGNLVQIFASADGYLSYQTSFQMFGDKTIDIELAEGDCYLTFDIRTYLYSDSGGYQTSPGAPEGTVVNYVINNEIEGSCDRDSGLYIPVHSGDSVTYTISAPGYETISGYENNITDITVNKYFMTPSDYYEFGVYNIPNANFVVVNGGICWNSSILNFKAGTELTIKVEDYGTYSFTMPAHNVSLDITALIS